MSIRMKDIARDVGVSVMTVSKVVRNQSDIGDQTRRRVLKRIRELGYTPNPTARALVTGRSNVAALIVPDLVHPFFAELAKGLSAELDASHSLVISSSDEEVDQEQRQIEHLLARRVDVLVIASVQPTPDSLRRIEERKTPIVLVDRRFAGWQGHFVGVDDRRMGRLATEHLIEVGCRRIAHIAGGKVSTALGRLEGYRETLREYDLPVSRELMVARLQGDHLGDVTGYRAMQQLLRRRHRPDGVFCYNDPTAMGAMQAILEAGLDVPQDIAVMGCGDVHYAPFLRVPLTSIGQQSDLIGRRAGQLALSLLAADRHRPPTTILLAPALRARQSTARKPPEKPARAG
jgi:LacI family transcriptional regulator